MLLKLVKQLIHALPTFGINTRALISTNSFKLHTKARV